MTANATQPAIDPNAIPAPVSPALTAAPTLAETVAPNVTVTTPLTTAEGTVAAPVAQTAQASTSTVAVTEAPPPAADPVQSDQNFSVTNTFTTTPGQNLDIGTELMRKGLSGSGFQNSTISHNSRDIVAEDGSNHIEHTVTINVSNMGIYASKDAAEGAVVAILNGALYNKDVINNVEGHKWRNSIINNSITATMGHSL